MAGMLSVRLTVAPDGSVPKVVRLADTLVVDPSQVADASDASSARGELLRVVNDGLLSASFPRCDEETKITIPFLFD